MDCDHDDNRDEESNAMPSYSRALEEFEAYDKDYADDQSEVPTLPGEVDVYYRGGADCDDTCASSVTTGFKDADLFNGSLYPSRQNLNVAEIPDTPSLDASNIGPPPLPTARRQVSHRLAPVVEGGDEESTAVLSIEDVKLKEKEVKEQSTRIDVFSDDDIKKQIKEFNGEDTKQQANASTNANSANTPKGKDDKQETEERAKMPEQDPLFFDRADCEDPDAKGTLVAVGIPEEKRPIAEHEAGLPGAFGVGQAAGLEDSGVDLMDASSGRLVEATPLQNEDDDMYMYGDTLPIATPEEKLSRKETQGSIIHHFGCIALVMVLVIVVVGGAFVGGMCGTGHCSSGSDPVPITSSPTSYRASLALEFEEQLLQAFGDDYFTEDQGSLIDIRRRALDWLVHEDPMQLDIDADNLIQRYILALFYFQTTLHRPWRICNPPAGPNDRDTCYYVEQYIPGTVLRESPFPEPSWLTDNHECSWAGIKCPIEGRRNVVELWLLYNELNGPLPTELAKLAGLKQLRLGFNADLTGTIPTELAELTMLEWLDLTRCSLKGKIPQELFKPLRNLKIIWASGNSLSGAIPTTIQFFPGERLILNDNLLTGSIPSELFSLSNNLMTLSLIGLNITGTIATEVGKLTNLDTLILKKTALSGTLPSEIGGMTALRTLGLGNTNVNGTIPEEIYTGLSNLAWLKVNNCALSGTISTNIGFLTNIYHLNLAENKFGGSIPTEVSALTKLEQFMVNGNQFTGTFPQSLCSRSFYAELWGVQLVADCTPDRDTGIPVMECACCTECCSADDGVCLPV